MEQYVTTRSTLFSRSNILNILTSSSLLVKVASGLLLLLYLCSYSKTIFDHLSVIPGYVLPPNFWVWTLLTHSFLQTHIVLVVVDICIIFLSGKFLEPLWSPLSLGIFFLITTVLSAIITSMIYMIVYYITGNTFYLFNVHVYGLGAYAGGFCVAVKQLMPNETVLTLPFGKIKNRHVPLICLLIAITLAFIGFINAPYPIQFGFGIIISWVYLRFYQKHNNGNQGDMAEDFSFASFFPPPLEIPVAIMSNTVFALLLKLKICKKPQRKYDVSSPTTITVTLPGTDPADAERRRQLAIKALNERLSKTNDEISWPGIDDEDDNLPEEVPEVVVTHSTPSSHPPSQQTSEGTKSTDEEIPAGTNSS